MTAKEKLVQAVLDLHPTDAAFAEIVVDEEAAEEADLNRIAVASTELVMRALAEEEREAGCEPWQP